MKILILQSIILNLEDSNNGSKKDTVQESLSELLRSFSSFRKHEEAKEKVDVNLIWKSLETINTITQKLDEVKLRNLDNQPSLKII